ncbi:MAG: cytochrome c [Thiolinea sp.]
MTALFKPASLTLATALTLSVLSTHLAADPIEDAIEYRQGAYTMIKHHFGTLGAMAKGKMEFDAETFRKNAEAVATLSQFPINGFIEGSFEGDTAAKPDIAENMDDFKQKMETFQIEAANLAKAAAEEGLTWRA